MPNPYLLIGLSRAPLTVQRIVAAVDSSAFDRRTDPGRFTLRESVAHLADWETILLDRMKMAVANQGSTIRAFDETERSRQMHYIDLDPVEQAKLFEERREVTVRFLRERAEGNWHCEVVHPERGVLTLYDQANLILGHDSYHVEHLSQYL